MHGSVCVRVCTCTHIPAIIGIQISSHKYVQLLPFFNHRSPSQGPNSMMGNKLKRMALIAHIQINKWRWFNAHSDKAGGNGGIWEKRGGGGWMEVMERCVVASKGGQAAEVELTAFVTVQVWSTAAVDQPPPQSCAHCRQTHTHSQGVCACVSLRPARQTHCEVFLPFLLSPFFHCSNSHSFYKGGPSLPALPSSQHTLNLSVHPSIYPPNQSVYLYSGIITTTIPHTLPPSFLFAFLRDWFCLFFCENYH